MELLDEFELVDPDECALEINIAVTTPPAIKAKRVIPEMAIQRINDFFIKRHKKKIR